MESYHVVLFVCCIFSIAAAASFPRASTIFTDVTKPFDLIRSSVRLKRTLRFTKEFDLTGLYIGSRHSDDVPDDSHRQHPFYMENLTVYVTEHNATQLAPQTEVGIGRFEGLMQYNSTIFVPLKSLREGEDMLRVRPQVDENTLYYFAIEHNVHVPGWYPYYEGIEVEYFGALDNYGQIDSGRIIGIEYSKPTNVE